MKDMKGKEIDSIPVEILKDIKSIPCEVKEEIKYLDSMILYLEKIKEDISMLSEKYDKTIPNPILLEKLGMVHSSLFYVFLMMRATCEKSKQENAVNKNFIVDEEEGEVSFPYTEGYL
ncbi:MAG: hypothetical protein KAX49_11735 [Halanaerobiales bacterium]|nr:hypothetical protein [Halanaerobiales bacterium]